DDFDPSAYVDTIYTEIAPGYGIPPMQWADLYKLYDFYLEDPSRWSDTSDDTTRRGTADPGTYQSVAASNWIEHVNTNKHITEVHDAYYAMFDARFFNRLTVVGGVRWESAKRESYGPWVENDALYLKNPDGTIFESTVRRFEGPVLMTSQGR